MTVGAIILTLAICFIPVIVMFAILPYIGRRTLTFGVSIPAAVHNDERLKAKRRSFSLSVVVIGVIMIAAAAVLYAFLAENLAVWISTALLFVYIFVIFALYVRAFKAVRTLKADEGWNAQASEVVMTDTQFAATRRSVSSLWFLLYAAIIAGTVLLGLLLYDRIPEQVIMQTDFSGTVTRMAAKTYGLVLFAPAMQAILSLLFGFIYWMMLKTPPVIDPDQPEISSMQNTKFRYRWSGFVVFGGVLMLLIFLAMQLVFAEVLPQTAAILIPLIGAGALVVAAIVLSVITGQSGSRIRVGKAADGTVIRRDDDRYWKWGSFYVNKNDPAMFVEKRFGVGFTLNFGRPAAILIFVGIIAVIIAIVVLSTTLTQ